MPILSGRAVLQDIHTDSCDRPIAAIFYNWECSYKPTIRENSGAGREFPQDSRTAIGFSRIVLNIVDKCESTTVF